MITIMLADDHQIVRQGLRAILEASADFSIIAEASDGLETIEKVTRYKPDVLVQDWVMPNLSGAELTREVKLHSPDTQVLILSMHAEEAYVLEALRNGALGYLLKNDSAAELKHAIHEVKSGHRYLGSLLSENAIDAYVRKSQSIQIDSYEALTTREREILGLICEGNTGGQIAERLSLSVRTVEMHRANFMNKLGLHSQVDIVRFAIKRGLISPDTL
ncbi:MAG: response regulator transcription factor [Chloroflexi bacterium]|nr:response regulator transcription factor [Chloroflexota bacterium]